MTVISVAIRIVLMMVPVRVVAVTILVASKYGINMVKASTAYKILFFFKSEKALSLVLGGI